MICVFFFFRNVRSTLLIAISLPISLLGTTAILKAMGITLNILTVSDLIVAMGRIVDDSIVILDNMYRKREESKDKSMLSILASNGIVLIDKIERNRKEGMDVKEAVLNGSLSRIRPILMTAAAIVLTLLPLAFFHNAYTVISQTLGIVDLKEGFK